MSANLHLGIPEPLLKDVLRRAEDEGITRSDLTRKALELYLSLAKIEDNGEEMLVRCRDNVWRRLVVVAR